MSDHTTNEAPARVLYCRCAYAKVISEEVKDEVLENLCDSGRAFDAVADLCEMSARKDPMLGALAAEGPLRVIACYPRAVEGLFRAAGTPLPPETEILNMRQMSADEIADRLAAPATPAAEETG